MTVKLDEESLLAEVAGETTLGELESQLAASGLTLDVDGAAGGNETVAAWLAEGAPGARDVWLDPADHLVAGLDFRLRDGRALVVRPAPRRAVGPDLIALVVGMNARFGSVERAWLRVHRRGVTRPAVAALAIERDPVLTPGEAALIEGLRRVLG